MQSVFYLTRDSKADTDIDNYFGQILLFRIFFTNGVGINLRLLEVQALKVVSVL